MGDGQTAGLILPCNNFVYSTLQVCSTLSEWERIAERFENATHYSEKALYRLLKNRIVPVVVADLRVGKATGVCNFVSLKPRLGNRTQKARSRAKEASRGSRYAP